MNKDKWLLWALNYGKRFLLPVGVIILIISGLLLLVTLVPLPAPRLPLFLLPPSVKENLCRGQNRSLDLHQSGNFLLYEHGAVATPEATLSLQGLIDRSGTPDGYIAYAALDEPRCYELKLYWFSEGFWGHYHLLTTD